jgi:hemoglobin
VTGDPPAVSVFDAVGGQRFFDDLVRRFYARVADDPVLRPLYPESDEAFDASARWLALFLGQYWGGPTGYSESRGHPRLRMRHAGFVVGRRERDAWYGAMAASVGESGVDEELRSRLLGYFSMAADHMINVPDTR